MITSFTAMQIVITSCFLFNQRHLANGMTCRLNLGADIELTSYTALHTNSVVL